MSGEGSPLVGRPAAGGMFRRTACWQAAELLLSADQGNCRTGLWVGSPLPFSGWSTQSLVLTPDFQPPHANTRPLPSLLRTQQHIWPWPSLHGLSPAPFMKAAQQAKGKGDRVAWKRASGCPSRLTTLSWRTVTSAQLHLIGERLAGWSGLALVCDLGKQLRA